MYSRSSSAAGHTSSSSSSKKSQQQRHMIDLSSIRPNIQWNVFSKGGPLLPYWFPSLQSITASLGYQYNDLKYLPAWVESTIKFALPGYSQYGNELQIQPSYVVKTSQKNVCIQFNHRRQSYLFIQLRNHLRKKRLLQQQQQVQQKFYSTATHSWMIDMIRGSWFWSVPSASISSIRITPTIDFNKYSGSSTSNNNNNNNNCIDYSCLLEAVTGGAGRTRISTK
jgi:hypothetical protein